MMALFVKIINGWKLFTIFAKKASSRMFYSVLNTTLLWISKQMKEPLWEALNIAIPTICGSFSEKHTRHEQFPNNLQDRFSVQQNCFWNKSRLLTSHQSTNPTLMSIISMTTEKTWLITATILLENTAFEENTSLKRRLEYFFSQITLRSLYVINDFHFPYRNCSFCQSRTLKY